MTSTAARAELAVAETAVAAEPRNGDQPGPAVTIDDALERLVTLVDDLGRDLETEQARALASARLPATASTVVTTDQTPVGARWFTLRNAPLILLGIVVVGALEYFLIGWFATVLDHLAGA
jgi:hypothetical protein